MNTRYFDINWYYVYEMGILLTGVVCIESVSAV